jgi:rRNA processing protein Gar1
MTTWFPVAVQIEDTKSPTSAQDIIDIRDIVKIGIIRDIAGRYPRAFRHVQTMRIESHEIWVGEKLFLSIVCFV